MPKVAYSQQDRERVEETLVTAALDLMARQGIQHTTVAQVCRAAGISRSFFYTFFPTKEDLVVEALYRQQPRVLALARQLMGDPALTWREGAERFFRTCLDGADSGIAVMTAEEQQMLFRRLSPESMETFRERQARLFSGLLECFGLRPDRDLLGLFTNITLALLVMRRAIPRTLPMFVPQAAEQTVEFQLNAILDYLERLR